MKVSLEWIKSFTPLEMDLKTFCEGMTQSGSKVESYEKEGEYILNVVTGKILSVSKHPNADKLKCCQVDVGYEVLPIVTGAPNIEEGQIVPVALVDALLAGGLKIKKGKLRGEISNGMLCSINELGYTSYEFPEAVEDGIFILPAQTALGQDIREVLGINQEIIEFEITPNRPDCFSVEGLAREAAITFNKPFKMRELTVTSSYPIETKSCMRLTVEAPDLCPRYMGRVVQNLRIKESPEWMKNRLRSAGVRSINNIVDITNYVMLEFGQPLHAFDLDQISGGEIIVRKAKQGEVMVTLDGNERILNQENLVIADQEKVVALAGVMGGENSEIKPDTKHLLLEAAYFTATSVRLTAKAMGLRTEASSRFEKGLSPENTARALDLACCLIIELDAGDICQGVLDFYPQKQEIVKIPFKPEAINDLLGTQIEKADILNYLVRVGCELSEQADAFIATVPTWRLDLCCLADLAEEVARFYGYEKIKPTLSLGKHNTLGFRTKDQRNQEQIIQHLISRGYFEAVTYAFESPKLFAEMNPDKEALLKQQVIIKNPLGEDYSAMRCSVIPSLLKLASFNQNRGNTEGGLFEIAATYHWLDDSHKTLPQEIQHVAAVRFSETSQKNGELYFEVKGDIEELASKLGILDLSFKRVEEKSWLHPGRSAEILIGTETVGLVGYIHPEFALQYELTHAVVILDLDLDKLLAPATNARKFKAFPKYPAIIRDLAFICNKDVMVSEVEKLIKDAAKPYLKSLKLFDVYEGQQIDAGKKSLAYNLEFNAEDRTLSDAEINPYIAKLLKNLAEHDIHLRDH